MDKMPITSLSAKAFVIPTDCPQSDGTASWTSTTIIVTELRAGKAQALGYAYGDAAAASVINRVIAPLLNGKDAADTPLHWRAMQVALRDAGRHGIAAAAISAVDIALWDAKAKQLDLPLASLLGCARKAVPVYGSGGFTCYDDRMLAKQLAGWVRRDGCGAVKMKVGARPERDPARVGIARAAIGDNVALYVDANGAYAVKQAICLARMFAEEYHVRVLEEPVSSDDLDGMRRVRDHVPAPMEIAAGEYAYDCYYVRRMLEAGAVDLQQADATRCGGVTGFMQIAALCEAFQTDLSALCAPSLHAHLGVAAPRFRHAEWHHDHARIEAMLFDGAPVPRRGELAPDFARPGLGLALKTADAQRYITAEAA